MPKKESRRRSASEERSAPKARRGSWPLALAIAVTAAAALVVVAWFASSRPNEQSSRRPTPWSRLGTQDVHSLAFASDSTDHLYFGHHGGILETRDGGRTWSPLPVRQDAMGMRTAPDGSIFVAGHEVFVASADGGRTWRDVPADLPNLDIHAFARDPGDPARMWAYLAEGGVYESRDAGRTWERVTADHRPQLVALRAGGATELIGLDPATGLARSTDGGRTWTFVSKPPSAPVVSLAATNDGRTVLVGTTDGLYRSDDSGAAWAQLLPHSAFAIALSADARSIAVVTQGTDFYRSHDGGKTWPGP